jgi:general secretion pathway protein G
MIRGIARQLNWVRASGVAIAAAIALSAPIGVTATTALLHGQSSSPQTAGHPASSTQAKETVLKDELFEMRRAIDRYYVDKKRYPRSLASLVNEGYITRIPKDPFTNVNTSWRTVQSKPDARRPAVTRGIQSVRSGSKGTALDGTKYSDW